VKNHKAFFFIMGFYSVSMLCAVSVIKVVERKRIHLDSEQTDSKLECTSVVRCSF
jgi:hypothetical protein